MSPGPTRQTPEGRAYLDLQNLARRRGRPTDELHQIYALEGFLDRLTRSAHAEDLILKGGVLLAAFASRRPTRDVDLAGRHLPNDIDTIQNAVGNIVTLDLEDGLSFARDTLAAEQIRENDAYSGVRVTVKGTLSTARLRFHVDVNVGDPITPPPRTVTLPRLLGGELTVTGYPIEMVLAEKIVTAVQWGTANTRWRDFADIARLTATHTIEGSQIATSLHRVAEHRSVDLKPLSELLNEGYATLVQDKWIAWRRKQRLQETAPERFADLVSQVTAFTDPLLTGNGQHRRWAPAIGAWTPEHAAGR